MSRLPPVLAAGALAVLTLLGPQAARAEDTETEERRARLKKAQTEFDAQEADFVRRVNTAIERGTKWLVSKQRADGHWKTYKPNTLDRVYPGRAGLIMLTLAKCGLELKGRDKVLQRGITALEGYRAWFETKATTAEQRGGHTYSNAILVLMYDALYAQHPKPKPERKRRAPAKAKRKRKNPCKLPKNVDAEMRTLIRWIEENQAAEVWRYPGPANADQDLSNTQYALLALQAAGRCGLETSAAVYRNALRYLLANQAKHGPSVQLYVANPAWQPGVDRYGPVMPARKARARGWSYVPGTQATGSMTTAGIACLAIIKERLRDLGSVWRNLSYIRQSTRYAAHAEGQLGYRWRSFRTAVRTVCASGAARGNLRSPLPIPSVASSAPETSSACATWARTTGIARARST